jgi:predicted nucleic acid-binding Zn ribbon protein
MEKLTDIFSKLIPQASANKEKFVLQLCLYVWTKSLGNAIRQNAQPIKYNNGTLFVEVADAQWKKQLEAMKSKFIQQLNNELRNNIIKDIIFVIKQR